MISKKTRNHVSVILASLSILFSFNVSAENKLPTVYEYGTRLDVKKVLSVSKDDSRICKAVDHEMKYIDSSGITQYVQYKGLSSKCNGGR